MTFMILTSSRAFSSLVERAWAKEAKTMSPNIPNMVDEYILNVDFELDLILCLLSFHFSNLRSVERKIEWMIRKQSTFVCNVMRRAAGTQDECPGNMQMQVVCCNIKKLNIIFFLNQEKGISSSLILAPIHDQVLWEFGTDTVCVDPQDKKLNCTRACFYAVMYVFIFEIN